jgi:phosphate transport system protein
MSLQMIQQLEVLRDRVLAMAELVEKALDGSVKILSHRDELEARRILDYEAAINGLEIEIDQLATQMLALTQPVAKDLRFITAAIKINSDLERMGDLAVNIARSSLQLLKHSATPSVGEIPEMARQVQEMVRTAVQAVAEGDDELARAVLRSDDSVDALKNRLFEQMVHGIEADATAAAANVDLIFIAHSLERIADHATNIAEDVLFFVKGVEVRHRTSLGPNASDRPPG